MNKLGELIKKHRTSKNMTQDQLSKKLGYSTVQFISTLEHGRCNPHYRKMKKISKVLNIPIRDIYKARVTDYGHELKTRLGLSN